MSLTEFSDDIRANPLDTVEQLASGNDWSFERASDNEITILVAGRWTDYQVSYTWMDGLEALRWGVSDALSRNFLDLDIETGVDNGRLMAYVAAHGEVMSRRFNESRVVIHCRLPQKYLGKVTEPGTVVRRHDPNGNGAVRIVPPIPIAESPSPS